MDDHYRKAVRQLQADPGDAGARAIVDAHNLRNYQGTVSTERFCPPDHPDLEEIACLSEPELSYEFHYLCVYRHKPTGRIFYGEDSGCSCPRPFESFHFSYDLSRVDTNLDEITHTSWGSFERRVESFPADYGERRRFAEKVKSLLG